MTPAGTSRDHGVLFARAYLDSKLAKLKEDQQAYLLETVKEWFDKMDDSSLKAHVASFIGPVLDVLGHIRSELGENLLSLYSDRSHQKAVALCYVVDPHESLDQTSKGRNYAVSLIIALGKIGLKWGILTNGLLWRLYCVREKAPFETYFQVDLGEALRTRDSKEIILLAEFFGATAFLPSETGRCRLDDNRHESDDETREIEKHLESKIESILSKICMGFIESEGKKLYSEDEKRVVFNNSIYLLYRILFVLYAEARGLLPLQNQEYYEKSMEKLMNVAKENHSKGITDLHSIEIWNSLSELFDWIDQGNHALLIPPYNGGLFDDGERPYLANHVINDAYLSEALFDLGFRDERGEIARIDYNDLAVRPLGSLYEGILEYQLFIAPERMVRRKEENVYRFLPETLAGKVTRTDIVIEKGDIYFSQSSEERKLTGSYYTPEDVVQYIVENSLGQYLADISKELRALIDTHVEAHTTAIDDKERQRIEKYIDSELLSFIENRVLSIKVLDPAMGSGHFLVNAAHFLSNFIVESLYSFAWENDSVDTSPLSWRRRVVEKCIFGVDLNDLATELAKLSLWLITADNKKPLTFLDHHLRTGNSLIGVKLDDLGTLPDKGKIFDERKFQTTLYYPIFRKEFVPRVLKLVNEMNFSTEEIEDVEMKKGKFLEWEKLKKNLQVVADTWLSTFFGHQIEEESYQLLLRNAVELKEVSADSKVEEIAEMEKNHFFHWWLEFPEVFLSSSENNGRCGFDVVIGNPPYLSFYSGHRVKIEEDEMKYFLENYRFISNKNKKGRFGTVMFFLEKSLDLVKNRGMVGFIIDLNIYSDAYYDIRKYIAERSHIMYFGENLTAFSEVGSGQEVLVLRKYEKLPQKLEIIVEDFSNKKKFMKLQNEINENNDYSFDFQEDTIIMEKIKQNCVKLEDVAILKSGMNIGGVKKFFLSNEKKDERFRKAIFSGNIKRYRLEYPSKGQVSNPDTLFLTFDKKIEKYIFDNKLGTPGIGGDNERYNKPKLFIRRPLTGDGRMACVYDDTDEFYCDVTVYLINHMDYDLSFLCGLLNSKLLSYINQSLGIIRMKEGQQPQITINRLKRTPIPKINLSNPLEKTIHDKIVSLVDKLHSLNKHLNEIGDKKTDEGAEIEEEINKTDAEIDELVYRIYEISESDKRIVEERLK